LEQLLEHVDGAALDGVIAVQPGIAAVDHDVAVAGGANERYRWLELAGELRDIARANGGTFELRDAPSAALAALDRPDAEIAGLDLMRAIQQQLDPHGVFARGRFVGGL